MNKLLGFYELKDSALPAIPWKVYERGTVLDPGLLWTVRTAVHRGDDLNLPRRVGVTADEAAAFAETISRKYGENGMVIFYPYFLADKSGTLNVYYDKVIIEAVKEDLWNLVTYSRKDVTVIMRGGKREYIGDRMFLKEAELNEISSYARDVRRLFRDELAEGKSILLEWSYAFNCDAHKNRRGERYLVFYEARTV